MKIFDEVKGFVNRSKVIQTFLTLYKWGKRINSHWDNLVRNTGSKYDILRVPLAIFMVTTVFLLGYLPANAWAVGTADEHNIWVAYTVGDVSFMHSVLRAVSMIMYGDGGIIQGAYRLACLLGIIWLIVKGIFSKQVIDIGSGFFVIFFYMCFFVPQSTLHIEDLQTKKYYTMEKIPLGVSVTLSLTSRIGKYFTDAYETVFVESSADSALCSAGSMNCNGYMGTLDMIAKARSSLQNHAAYLAINKAMCNGSEDISSCDIERSILNYTKDCTVQKLMSPTERFTLKNVTGFKVNGDTQKEMKFNSKRHYTKVYAGPGKDGVMNCLEAGNFIATAFENNRVKTTIYNMAFPHHNLTTAGGAVNDGGSGTDNGTREGTYDVAAMQTDMDAALGGLGGQTADSYEYLKNVLIRPLMEKGLRDGFIDQNQLSAQIALDTAISQRNLQLAAESSMFATMIRPLTTFLEGFVLALTPLMPFILLLGINAFGVVMKYLLVLFWIQLWAPALAICNMYVQNVVKENLALALGGTDITSFTGIETATPVIQHWLAVGGMMGASVPVLTLFILSGSIYTFNTLATSIKGGDHFDEKAIQPDALKRAAYMNTSVGSYNVSSGGGSIEAETQSRYKQYSQQDVSQVAVQSSRAEAIETGNQLLKTLGAAWSRTKNGQATNSFIKNSAKAWQATDSVGYQKARDWVKQVAQDNGLTLTNEQAGQIAVSVMAEAHAGVEGSTGFKALGNGVEANVGASVRAAVSGDKKWSDTEASTFTSKILEAAGDKENITKMKNMQDSYSQSLASMDQHAITDGVSQNDMYNVNKAHSRAQKAQRTYQENISRANSSSSSKSMYSNQIASLIDQNATNNWLSQNQDTWKELAKTAKTNGYGGGMTGVYSAAVEYALDNQNDAKAQELAKIMGLQDIIPGYHMQTVTNTVNADDSDNVSGEGENLKQQTTSQLSAVESEVTANDQTSVVETEKAKTSKELKDNEEGLNEVTDAATQQVNDNVEAGKHLRAGLRSAEETASTVSEGTFVEKAQEFTDGTNGFATMHSDRTPPAEKLNTGSLRPPKV